MATRLTKRAVRVLRWAENGPTHVCSLRWFRKLLDPLVDDGLAVVEVVSPWESRYSLTAAGRRALAVVDNRNALEDAEDLARFLRTNALPLPARLRALLRRGSRNPSRIAFA